jgi:hypothetical protein
MSSWLVIGISSAFVAGQGRFGIGQYIQDGGSQAVSVCQAALAYEYSNISDTVSGDSAR